MAAAVAETSDLSTAMRTTGTCRYFRPDPVPDEVLHSAFDDARFGPQGGNRQPVRWIVVASAERKRALAELYLPMWKGYLEGVTGGTVEANALPRTVADADRFAEHLAEVPAIVVVCAERSGLHPTDHELGRLSVVGGASIYPVMQNLCLALRSRGVASAVTTLLCHQEPAVRELLEIPEEFITAAHIAVGYPEKGFPTKLARTPVAEAVSSETFGTALFPRAHPAS
ncbi:nitroreductase family protein [Pseudonocardia sp. KRD291]|uniref:nitroreductase family protein n=1 Tax=Pseudonocardia sp. KRD291 TaxID=2792007 RepID=UPI001C49DCF6|nr:nitroreductase family protein [Pseudonocardia sp. KRD291]MBW0105617.1 nitroreductase family protein [Pseudonocardia sp. KRD291]